jgi:glycosyltransferase involved in cell wall biosynthesis
MGSIVSKTTKCKILYVIDNIEFGGGERGFAQLINRLPEDRYKISVACLLGGVFEKKIERSRAKVIFLDLRSRFNPGNILRLANIMKRERIDIVHSQGARADFFARVAGRIARASHILSTTQMPVEGFEAGFLRKRIYRFFDGFTERYVDRFIVVSDSLKTHLIEKRQIPGHKIIRIYNGIELDQYHTKTGGDNFRKELGISQDVHLIGAIGRMVRQKGFKYLIQAIPDIVRDIPDPKFLFVGDGPLRERLEALSEELRVKDNVIFAGFRSDIKEILSAIDILVIPSLLEGFPMITLEAMAMAKPIVATNIDGITEQILDGINGILVPPKDPSALAKSVIGVLNDRETARTMGLAARKKVEQEFSVEMMVSETERVYQSLA